MLNDTAVIPPAAGTQESAAALDSPLDALTVRALVENAALPISPLWPLRTFIACNPLTGFENLSFEEAVRHGQDWFGARGFPSRAMGQAALQQGKIAQTPLRRAIAHHTHALEPSFTVLGRTVRTAEILRAFMLTAAPAPVGIPETLEPPAAQRLQTELAAALNRVTVKWTAAFLDEGQAVWSMPGREKGFYGAWKSLAEFDDQLLSLLDEPARRQVASLPARPEQAIEDSLRALRIPVADREHYLALHLTSLPGWAGFIKWRGSQMDHVWQSRYPISLIDYLAVRLGMERLLVESASRHPHRAEHPVTRLMGTSAPPVAIGIAEQDRETFQAVIARHAGLGKEDIAALGPADRETMESLLAVCLEIEGRIWLEAWEETFRGSLLGELADVVPTLNQDGERDRPVAHLVFCIDVRSEPFRRNLESLGAYETLGFAGFFGIPVHYTPFGALDGLASCPVLLQPKHRVTEIPKADQQRQAARHLKGLSLTKTLKALLVSLKHNIVAPFAFVETSGGIFGLLMAARTLAPVTLGHFQQALKNFFVPPVALQATIALPPSAEEAAPGHVHGPQCGHRFGLTADQQVFYAEAGLRMMGLIDNFGPLVVLCGHGGMTVNNPYAAGLDCGACGGNHGGPNARIMASVYNDRRVRAVLRERGIVIPHDTVFLAAEHNTTTDEVTIYNSADAPDSHADHIQRLRADLEIVRHKTCAERCLKFGQLGLDEHGARAHAQHRALDWAQVRPEWGLARNGAFIVGPRALTQSLNLDSRCFLHSYDWKIDTEGKALEIILTAPLVVAEWINTQYYFSTVDNVHYGSGSKITHNVTGKIGVMQGNASDLMTGLPLQSLTVREGELYHEPLRLMAVVYAPLSWVSEIIARNTILQHFFDNGWVALTVIDPGTGRLMRYRKGKIWEDFSAGKGDEDSGLINRAPRAGVRKNPEPAAHGKAPKAAQASTSLPVLEQSI